MNKLSVLGVLALLAASACGSVNAPKTDAGDVNPDVGASDFALALDQSSLSMAIAGKTDVTVTLTRGSGFTDSVALTATGLPTGVTATFAASSLPGGTDSTTMTLTIDQTASAGTTDLMVTGKAGALEHSSMVSLELHTSTIAGKVRYNSQNITVRLVGKAATQTDATGNFSFTDVKLPYDIYVVGQVGTTNAMIPAIAYYKGLTRLDPVVTQPTPVCSLCATLLGNSGRITGSRGGTGSNTEPLYVSWSTGGGQTAANGSYDFNGSWSNFMQTTKAGTLTALQATRGALGAPNGWHYGTTNATINQGTTANPVGVTLAQLATTAALSGTVTAPAGFPNPTLSLTQQSGGYPFEVWTATTTNATSTIPLLTGQKASMYAISSSGGRITEGVFPALAAATDVTMALPPPAGITGPVSGATGVTTTTPFEYTTSANQIYMTTFSNSTATFIVYASTGSITIPNVTEMALPTGAASYSWTVKGYGPYASVDGAADPAPLEDVAKLDLDGTWHSMTTNPARSFTTQ